MGLSIQTTQNEASADGSILVLGPQRRYTIENYVLRPALDCRLIAARSAWS